jgi:hypothetical protein
MGAGSRIESGADAHQGPTTNAVTATAPVTCATNGIRARTGSHRGQMKDSQRDAGAG